MRLLLAAKDERGAQIVEFAVVLPLLAVLIVGITDFGQAFAIKQKLTFAARDAARFGSSQPTNDLTQTTPPSIMAIRDLVDADLLAGGIDDCGLTSNSPVPGGTVQWSVTAACANSGTFTLTIDRGDKTAQVNLGTGAQGNTYLISTHVKIIYPFQWRFAGMIRLLVPNANYAGILQLQTDAFAPNQD